MEHRVESKQVEPQRVAWGGMGVAALVAMLGLACGCMSAPTRQTAPDAVADAAGDPATADQGGESEGGSLPDQGGDAAGEPGADADQPDPGADAGQPDPGADTDQQDAGADPTTGDQGCVGPECGLACETHADCGAHRFCAGHAGGTGQCASSCVDACPEGLGYRKHDGCHCRVPPTGVDKCHIPLGWADCATINPDEEGYGQDGTAGNGPLQLEDQGDGRVIDLLTGLEWSREVLVAYKTWEEALSICEANIAGLPGEGWTLPPAHALLGILDFGSEAPHWPHGAFGEAGGAETWTATPAVLGGGTPMIEVDFSNAQVAVTQTTNPHDGRCVRLPPGAGVADRFVATTAGTVADRVTGLEWGVQNACAQCGWIAALAACQALGGGWRLPNAKELMSIVEYRPGACSRLPAAFGDDCPAYFDYWSSTPYPNGDAAIVQFDAGYMMPLGYMEKAAARCVRELP